MGFYEYLNEARLPHNRTYDYDMDIEDAVNTYLKQHYDPQIAAKLKQCRDDVVRANPNIGQTISNWWTNLKNFGKKMWTGKWGEWDQRYIYDAKLYNLVETYVTTIYNETNIANIDQILLAFTNDLRVIFKDGMLNLGIYGLQKGRKEILRNTAAEQPKPKLDQPKPKLDIEPPKPKLEPKSKQPKSDSKLNNYVQVVGAGPARMLEPESAEEAAAAIARAAGLID